ncbi:helix-turn-helix domain-containing protein [Pseudogracilibacillus sp. ICA-222130]|uniref:helix-turn-helix domain-containing protein n=1 Tax=Pseudogracilibacillus sp. ICA-222130 TaxID=3134655 RepID=UPI0030BA56EB
MFQQIILYCLYKMEGERSVNSPYYIIQGKQSIQTIQDANLFHLNRFFTIYKQLDKNVYDREILSLVEADKLKIVGQQYTLCNMTDESILQLQDEISMYHLNGKQLAQMDRIFFERLLLLIQVWTNKSVGNKQYIPIVENRSVEQWVKLVYGKTKDRVNECLDKLYIELRSLLVQVTELGAALFVDQLTGATIIGQSKQQLVDKYKLDIADIELETLNVIHYMLQHIDVDQHPILCLMKQQIRDETIHSKLTHSTKQTYNLWQQGYPLEKIASIRKLKLNTIYDHLVEIALYEPNFPYEQFITLDKIEEINGAIQRTKTFKLKPIKDHVCPSITYFQIRLAFIYLQKKGEGDK